MLSATHLHLLLQTLISVPKREKNERRIIMKTKSVISILVLTGFALSAVAYDHTGGRYDQQIQSRVTDELAKKQQFQNLNTSVDDGIVTLSGAVDVYIDKVNAEKRARKVKYVDGVRNHIQVAGKTIADSDLRENLANKLRYDRIGYGIVFNNLTVSVDNGTVTVGGKVRDYPDRDSAIAVVSTAPGVKEVVDEIDVAPLSAFDDNLRIRLAHAIYGQASLQKYATDPQAPIRIVVDNGHVELAGVVLNDMDRQLAFTQASSVSGVFSVKNDLVVAR
jgi:osmotically-inducible protein OsmY